MKDSIVGLLDRQKPPPRQWFERGVVGFVLKVRWADLQPDPFGFLNTDLIDSYVQGCSGKTGNLAGMVMKLRVLAGVDSPEWVKRISGSMVWNNPDLAASSEGGLVPCWWTPAFVAAYENLHQRLAKKYDAIDCIRAVSISGPTTLYDECMARQIAHSPDNLHAAMCQGFSFERDLVSIYDFCAMHGELWRNTKSSIGIQPVPWGRTGFPTPASRSPFWDALVGPHPNMEIGNHSLATPKLVNSDWQGFYSWMKAIPELYPSTPPRVTYLQTESMRQIGSVPEVMQAARGLGASYVELPKGYEKWSDTWFFDWLK